MPHRAVTRSVAMLSIAVLAGATAACGGGSESAESGGPLRVTMANHVYTTALEELIPEFEQESGIDVELTAFGEDQLSDQYNVQLNAGSDEIDVMMFRPLQEGRLFAQNEWLSDLTTDVEEAGDWDWDDFEEGPKAAVTIDDTVRGVPIITEREVLYYRKDLLEAAGLEVPTTLEELEAAAAAISAANPGVNGFVARGSRAPAVTQFSSFLYSFGGDWTTEDGKAAVATEEAKAAYAFYGGLLSQYGPPGTTNMSWPEAMAVFTQGQAAFYTEADSLYQNATDPAKSTVAETVGFAQFPAGPAGSKPYNIPSWALGINETSPNRDAAWEFIQWATSAEMVTQLQEGGVPGARASVWADPAALAGFPEDLAAAITASLESGVGHDRPEVVQVSQARDIVGTPIVTAIEGGDAAAAADEAAEEFQALLDEENE